MPILLRFDRLLFCGVMLGATASTWGQLPPSSPAPRRHSLSLEAQSVSNGGPSQTSGRVNGALNGTYVRESQSVSDTRVAKSTQFVQFTVRNYAATPDKAVVEWYFMAAPVSTVPTGKEFIFDRGSQDFTVPGNGVQTQTVNSKEAEAVYTRASTISTYNPSGSSAGTTSVTYRNSQKGTTLRGWFVRLIVDGRVIATKGSSQKYEDLAANESQLKELAGDPATSNVHLPASASRGTAPGQRPTGPSLPPVVVPGQ